MSTNATAGTPTAPETQTAQFNADYAADDAGLVQEMLARNPISDGARARIRERAHKYVEAIRQAPKGAGLEDFMQEYSLSTKEGLALMVLAEALLRVPDAETQDRLIRDKLSAGEWAAPDGDEGWLLMAASWGIGLSARIVTPGETPGGVLTGLVKRLGTPVIRTGVRQAMHYLGHNFVLGQTINAALERASKQEKQGFRYSYDMLGEGARTDADAARYYDAYANAIARIGDRAEGRNQALPDRPGISVKLSALSPRYFLKNSEAVLADLVPKVTALAEQAKAFDLNFTIDAEEADRLELSLDVFAAVARQTSVAGWSGFGLAVQAYQKRAPQVIQYVAQLAEELDRRFMVRLVKGAYWDTEVKRAQERGLEGFPVFTRKTATDLCYLDCAREMLGARPRIYPQFATHNAVTMAALMEIAGDPEGTETSFEFQRLHGMGETLYDAEMNDAGVPVRIYAPVGGYRDLLAYLVRRLLENAANSSFVAQIADDGVSTDELLTLPQDELAGLTEPPVHARIKTPLNIYPDRPNSRGFELGHRPHLVVINQGIAAFDGAAEPVTSTVGAVAVEPSGNVYPITNPADLEKPLGEWVEASVADVEAAVDAATATFPTWNSLGPHKRGELIERYADLLEERMPQLISILVREAGKTVDDAIAEVREAVDFCRYYAVQARAIMAPQELPSPVGERNVFFMEGRGAWAAISPWNFPLAIFTGQLVAALATGNTVVAKPAPQTNLIAHTAVQLMHEAGIPAGVCNLVLGHGEIGATLINDTRIAGVVFTGSTATAQSINRALAQRPGDIIPLIAETGGINAMIVDSTALPEQVADAVVGSAFKSAGQRCSALRMLYVQEDVADATIEMIAGLTAAQAVDNPADLNTDIGPIIDAAAISRLEAHWSAMKAIDGARVIYEGACPDDGTFMGPRIIEVPTLETLQAEAFGPILHVARFAADQFDEVLAAIKGTGYGLTFGIHSRLEDRKAKLAAAAPTGNVYINRNMVGAIVGVQPFGGRGLSGTGPKAGGPNYLPRFCEEKVITEDTTAAGGNASLIAMSDE